MAEDPRTLHVHQAMTYRATFSWLTNTATPSAISLDGFTVTFRVLSRPGKEPPLLTATSESFSTEEGGVEVHPGGQVGVARVTLTAAQTAALRRSGAYVISAAPTDAVEPVEYVASGPLEVILLGA